VWAGTLLVPLVVAIAFALGTSASTPTTDRRAPLKSSDLTSPTPRVTNQALGDVPPPTPLGHRGAWTLVMRDEFDGRQLGDLWHRCYWWSTTTCRNESSGELQLYRRDNVTVGGGVLRLEAREERVSADGGDYDYTSGLVSTGGADDLDGPGFKYMYGDVEARLRVPEGRGLWPAFWLLPTSHRSRPEVDILEVHGDSTSTLRFHVHFKRADEDIDVGLDAHGPDAAGDFHVYGLQWTADALAFYVDGEERWRYDGPSVPREPMYVLLNLAVGGDWPGNPTPDTRFPAALLVDYVRVWRAS
jgi:beta-glucanase (GH16 family)